MVRPSLRDGHRGAFGENVYRREQYLGLDETPKNVAIFDGRIARIRSRATCSRKIFLVISDTKRYLNDSLELLVNLIGLESLLSTEGISRIFQATSLMPEIFGRRVICSSKTEKAPFGPLCGPVIRPVRVAVLIGYSEIGNRCRVVRREQCEIPL